jgi:class 3 adenylate cyclase
MRDRFRIPITAITVFGTSCLLALSVGIVLYLGFNQVAESTRQLWADQSKTLIDRMEQSLDSLLRPVRDQALWVASDIKSIGDPESLDDYMFGVLAATPQVAGIAIVTADGKSRRWHRERRLAITEDWSTRPEIMEWLDQVKVETQPAWRAPIWVSDPVDTTSLLHDIPLTSDSGEFIGVFAQVIAVEALSDFLSISYSETGITPFVLYDRDYVLAHPALSQLETKQVLPRINDLDDLVLERIWSPDNDSTFIAEVLEDTEAKGVFMGDKYFMFLYRDIEHYGPSSWTVGAYLNTSLLPDDELGRIFNAMWIGLAVLCLGIVASIIVGRKVSSPIKAIVAAANTVDAGKLGSLAALGSSRIRELDDANQAFNNMIKGLRERELIRDTLGRFVPEKVASSLLTGGGEIEVQHTDATILFCDIESFTALTESLGPVKIVAVLNAYFSAMVDILERYEGVVTQFQGDAILATFNVPMTNRDHAVNAIRAAQDMLSSVEALRFDGEKLNIRIGINTGSVVAGAIGAKGRLNYTVHGDAVNLAARIEEMNKTYGTRLLISDRTAVLLPQITFRTVGETTARGQSQSITLHTLDNRIE